MLQNEDHLLALPIQYRMDITAWHLVLGRGRDVAT
jgi:hypothetical protein